VLECPQVELAQAAALVQSVMESAYPLNAPLKTEARSGLSWGEMKPIQ